jgi:E3 ubiquitin-protein ligase UBR1
MQPRHLTAPTSDPHRQLHDLLQHSAHHRSGRWSPSVKASALRALFTSIWQSEEWLAYFDVLEERKPAQWGLGEWLGHDETGRKAWKLSEHQARMREKRGKEREEVPKQGRMCGKTLHRYDRTYTCK